MYCKILGVWVLMILCFIAGSEAENYLWKKRVDASIVFGPATFESTVITESEDDLTIAEFKCEFDPPLKHITLIMHYYDTYEELNDEYRELQEDTDEIWGWSSCIWQPEDSWAACDVYQRIPEYVEDVGDDYAIQTLGHETWHAACGDFHD